MKITDTARMIARVRAAESALPENERLFDDPFAALFAGETDAIAGQFEAVPFFREQIRIRTKFIDDFVRDGVRDGFRQLVILGAGFDCRALRIPELASSGPLVFEVDLAEQVAAKRDALASGGVRVPEWLHCVACDFTAPDFASALTAALVERGFSPRAPSLFVWEGVISWLDASDIERTFRWIASAGAMRARLVFNYPLNGLTGNDPQGMRQRANAVGFTAVDDRSFGDIYRRYFGAESESDAAELFRLAVAER